MPLPPHPHGVDYVEFGATDLAAVEAFYSAAFGWTFEHWGDAYVSFDDGRLAGGFYRAEAVASGGALVVLYSADLKATEQAVRAAGGRVTKDTFSFPGGRRFHFADPSGNELAVWSDVSADGE